MDEEQEVFPVSFLLEFRWKFSEAIFQKNFRVIIFLESTSRGCSKYDKGNVQLYLWNCRYSKLCSKISTDRFVVRNYEDFKIHFSVVEQEIFQTFATKNHPEVDLAGLIFDGLPVKLVKDACPIARRQAADLVSYFLLLIRDFFNKIWNRNYWYMLQNQFIENVRQVKSVF